MTTRTRLERELPTILDDLAAGPYPDYVDDVLGRTVRMRQRPAWMSLERWFPMADVISRSAFAPRLPSRAVGVALVILALLIAAVVAFVGTHATRVPAPFGPARNGLIPYAAGSDLYLGDPTTGSSRLLLGGPAVDSAPQFSPDGTKLAFIRDGEAIGGGAVRLVDVYVIREDGSSVTRITPAPIDASVVTWMPDGLSVAVIHTIDGVNQLDLFDATGSQPPRRLAAAAGLDSIGFRPPDGHTILYRALVGQKWGLFAMDADGTNARAVVPATVPAEVDMSFASVAYSADGTRIFYQHGDASGCCQLWVMNADGTNQHEFRALGPAWDGQPVVSPDGTRIAYWHNPNDGPLHGITVVRADGTGPVVETGPKFTGTAHWLWSPDSTKILAFPNDASAASAYLLDPAGGPWTTVPWGSDADIDWQRLAP